MDQPKHHIKQPVCATRSPYREGRKATAVKVYTVNQESIYVLVQGVPSVGTSRELMRLFEAQGDLDDHRVLDEYPAAQFTETHLFKYKRIQSARFAKRKLDDWSFYGGVLHVCYAPEYENVEETRNKLRDRNRIILAKTRQYKKDGTYDLNPGTNEQTNGSTPQQLKSHPNDHHSKHTNDRTDFENGFDGDFEEHSIGDQHSVDNVAADHINFVPSSSLEEPTECAIHQPQYNNQSFQYPSSSFHLHSDTVSGFSEVRAPFPNRRTTHNGTGSGFSNVHGNFSDRHTTAKQTNQAVQQAQAMNRYGSKSKSAVTSIEIKSGQQKEVLANKLSSDHNTSECSNELERISNKSGRISNQSNNPGGISNDPGRISIESGRTVSNEQVSIPFETDSETNLKDKALKRPMRVSEPDEHRKVENKHNSEILVLPPPPKQRKMCFTANKTYQLGHGKVPSAQATFPEGFDARTNKSTVNSVAKIDLSDKNVDDTKVSSIKRVSNSDKQISLVSKTSQVSNKSQMSGVANIGKVSNTATMFVPRQTQKKSQMVHIPLSKQPSKQTSEQKDKVETNDELNKQLKKNAFILKDKQGPADIVKTRKTVIVAEESVKQTVTQIRDKMSSISNVSRKK
ncbi:RBM48-like protein [Mya arenaria]|uniref:RNA-binding protein 48 n=1 Tax=Mya arenaria TaxID=6604 RepID=A0ABY7D996_MYAAR|nr:uncharacterized protein LOC128228577 [Mya arenaria]WAQ93671.1 RBM48-like protein [Mya arenaria]